MMNVRPAAQAALLTALVSAFAGCGQSTPSATTTSEGGTPTNPVAGAGDPWKDALLALRRENDPAECKAVLNKLNADLGSRPVAERPAATSPEAVDAVAAIVPLSETDRKEITSPVFNGLDAAYLAECLYLRDAARSLDAAGEPPARQAEVAFAWVCRQMYLDPWGWQVPQGIVATALSPSATLPRGSGSGLERAYAFLALLQQFGIDGCLIGPPDANEKPAGYTPPGPDGKPATAYPRGPFWAVGARVGKDVLLFDPWRGKPFPGPDGKGTGTLAQVRSNPDQLKAWFDEKNSPSPLTADDVKKASVSLAVPVSSLSRRIQQLETKLQPETGLRLAFEPAALRDRFLKESLAGPAFPEARVMFWSPIRDRFDYGHTLARNLPTEEGGWDSTPPGAEQLWAAAKMHQVPITNFRRIPELAGARPKLQERFLTAVVSSYASNFLTPPTPRERLQRGQFQDAARFLVEKQDLFQRGIELARSDRSDVKPWIDKANALYLTFERARLKGDSIGEADALAAIDQHWRNGARTVQLLADTFMAQLGVAEATFLLAVCKHEVAERSQFRLERASPAERAALQADAREAWEVARDSWASYQFRGTAQATSPGRAELAKTLSDRAAAMANAK